MSIPTTLRQRIVEFLTHLPNIHDSQSQQAFLNSAVLDESLLNQLPVGISPIQFVELLVATCLKYGRLHDGRHALDAVLEAAMKYVGQDGRAACEALLQEHKEHRTILQNDQFEKERDARERHVHEVRSAEHIHQKSKGNQSPNIVTQGDVTIHYES